MTVIASVAVPTAATVDEGGKLRGSITAPANNPTPAIETVLDDKGAKQGATENGGHTDDSRPEITGKAAAGVVVHIYDNSELIGKVTVSASEVWSFIPRSPLVDGRHEITVIYEYTDGDVSDVSVPYVIFVDKVAPEIPAILGMMDDEGRITGAIASEGVTDDNRPVIDGTTEANATVIVYDKGKEIGRAQADATGQWSFTPEPPLADGTHILEYVAVDQAGNQSEKSGSFEFLVDTRPELVNIDNADDDFGSITGLLLSGSATDDATPTLHGTATAGGIVTFYEGAVLLGQTTAGADGRWTFTPATPLSEGPHALQATVTLVAKGESERSPNFNLTVDLSGPDAPTIDEVIDDVGSHQGGLANGAITDDDTPTLKGKADAGNTVRVYDNGNLLGSAVADVNGDWSYTPIAPLSNGEHVFTAMAVDKVGNSSESSDSHGVVVDTIAPDKPIIVSVLDDAGAIKGEVAHEGSTDDTLPLISGTAEAGSTVIIRDKGVEIGRASVDADGKWSFEPGTPLGKGDHELTVEAQDGAGNTSIPSDAFNFSIVSNGDDYLGPLGQDGNSAVSLTMVLDNSASMTVPLLAAAKAALKTTVETYLRLGSTITIDLHEAYACGKFTITGLEDPAYTAFLSSLNAIDVNGMYTHETVVKRVAAAIKAEYADPDFDPNTPTQVFFFGDGISEVSAATTADWQSMLEELPGTLAISSTFVLIPAAPKNSEYPGYQKYVDGLVNQPLLEAPNASQIEDFVASLLILDTATGNLLDNDEDVLRDGSERLTEVSLEGQVFRIDASNALVIENPDPVASAHYDSTSGRLTIDTAAGRLFVYMTGNARHDVGDYVYQAKVSEETTLGGAIKQVFGYVATSNGGAQASNLYIDIVQQEGAAKITVMGKDSGAMGDFTTADGSAGREISGTLDVKLAAGLKVQVSLDGGQTWHDAVTKGTNWMFLDMTAHASSWEIQTRISDGVTHGERVQSQQVTLADGYGAPSITRIPDAEGIYTVAKAKDGSQVILSLLNTGAKAGDTVHIQWGSTTHDQVLTELDISSSLVSINVPATATYTTQGVAKDFSVTAQIIGKDGAIGPLSNSYEVVGTLIKANVTDTLQLNPVGNEYAGAGFTITTAGSLSKTAATATTLAGLTLTGDGQYDATFTLDKPASYFTLRLTGEHNDRGARVEVFDLKGDLIHSEFFIGGTDARHTKVFSFTSAEAVDIGSFKVLSLAPSVTLDAFTQTVVTHTAETRDPNLIDYALESFAGSAGNDVVSLSITSATYFNQLSAGIHGGSGIDTLKLVGTNHQLNLATAGSKVSSMEIIDLTGTGNNTLTLGLSQVLENGAVNAFYAGDKSRVQMLVNGNTGDKVNLSDLLANGNDFGDWVKASAVIVDGLAYDSYQHSALGAELLVQIGVAVTVTNSAAVGVGSTFGTEQIESTALPVEVAMLTLNLSQVMNEGGVDLFHEGEQSRTQMMVKGNAGDSINLDDLLDDGVTDLGDWSVAGNQAVDGVAYTVYQHSGANVELLVQESVMVNLV